MRALYRCDPCDREVSSKPGGYWCSRCCRKMTLVATFNDSVELDKPAPSNVGCDFCCGSESDHERGCCKEQS